MLEFRAHWQTLLAASVDPAVGTMLIADLGWSKGDFALVGSLPFAGRFTDRYGLRIAQFDTKSFSLLLSFTNMMDGAGVLPGSIMPTRLRGGVR